MVTRCKCCNKPLALKPNAWASRDGMYCSIECGIAEAMKMYEPGEYADDADLHNKATKYFFDVAEEISRDEYGARTEHYAAYSTDYDMSTVFEQVFEGDELIAITCVGWHFGKPDRQIDEECKSYGMTATFVD